MSDDKSVCERRKSRDSASETTLSPPENHWLYRQHLDLIASEARCLAVVI
jgi:hypothetical protein